MGQFRAAVRAKNKRSAAERRKLLRPTLATLVLIACIQYRAHAARIRRIGEKIGQYIRDRLRAPSFMEQILPVIPASGRLVFANPRRQHTWRNPWEKS